MASFVRRCDNCVAGRACLRPTKISTQYGDAPADKTPSVSSDRTAESAYNSGRSATFPTRRPPTPGCKSARSAAPQGPSAKPSQRNRGPKPAPPQRSMIRLIYLAFLPQEPPGSRRSRSSQHRKPLAGPPSNSARSAWPVLLIDRIERAPMTAAPATTAHVRHDIRRPENRLDSAIRRSHPPSSPPCANAWLLNPVAIADALHPGPLIVTSQIRAAHLALESQECGGARFQCRRRA